MPDQVNSFAQRATAVVHHDIARAEPKFDELLKNRGALLFPNWVRPEGRVGPCFATKTTLYCVNVELPKVAPWVVLQPAPVRSKIRPSIAKGRPSIAYPSANSLRRVERADK